MYLHGFKESPSLFKYSFVDPSQIFLQGLSVSSLYLFAKLHVDLFSLKGFR